MKSSAVRDNIIETAADLFYKNGYNLTGINEIIKEAGIAKATLYNHFKSKDDICLAFLDYKNSRFLKDIERFSLAASNGQEQVLALFDFLKKFYNSNEFNGCWCINTISEIPRGEEVIRAEIQKQKIKFIDLIESLITENFPKYSSTEIDILSRQVYLLYEGAVAESHLHQEVWPIDQARKLTQKIIN